MSWRKSATKFFQCQPSPTCRNEFSPHISGFKPFSSSSLRLPILLTDPILSLKTRLEILSPWSSLLPWPYWISQCMAPELKRPWLWEFIKVSSEFSLPRNTRVGTNLGIETRDGKKSNNPEMSEAMRVKNRAFSHNHAMSIHLNMLAMGATLWYGLRLASRIQV